MNSSLKAFLFSNIFLVLSLASVVIFSQEKNASEVEINAEAVEPGAKDSEVLETKDLEVFDTQNKINDSEPENEYYLKSFFYSRKGRRDPFQPYVKAKPVETVAESDEEVDEILASEWERFSLNSYFVTGILWDVQHPKAIIKIRSSGSGNLSKKYLIIKEGDKLGSEGGYVAKIREGEIVVIEEKKEEGIGKTFYTTKVMPIQVSKGSKRKAINTTQEKPGDQLKKITESLSPEQRKQIESIMKDQSRTGGL